MGRDENRMRSEIAKLGVSLTLSLLRTFDTGGPVQCYRTYLPRGFVIYYILGRRPSVWSKSV